MLYRGDDKNKTKRFYGLATSCNELGKLGYTLNGLYLVDCKDQSKKSIYCQFKQPNGIKKKIY